MTNWDDDGGKYANLDRQRQREARNDFHISVSALILWLLLAAGLGYLASFLWRLV